MYVYAAGSLANFWFSKKGGVGVPARAAAWAQRQEEGLVLSKLVCDALDRASPDSKRLGHLQDTLTPRKLLSHLAFGRSVYLRAAELHALSDGALEACFDPLANHRPLKFGKGAGYLKNEPAHRGRCVDGVGLGTSPRRTLPGVGSCRVNQSASGP